MIEQLQLAREFHSSQANNASVLRSEDVNEI